MSLWCDELERDMKRFSKIWAILIATGFLRISSSSPTLAHEGHMMTHNHPYPTKKFSEERGRKIYVANCAACHGVNGDGKGPAAGALKPRPTDFLDLKYMPMCSRVDHYYAIANGRPKTTMAPWKGSLSENDIWDVIAYIEHLFNHQAEAKSGP